MRVARIREKRKEHMALVSKSEGKRSVGRFRRRWSAKLNWMLKK